jgi:hypothetical protein
MRIAGLIVGFVVMAGCKKSYEEEKKQAVAIREKAFACADVTCAKAAEAEYYKLTSGLHDLPKADADFFFGENSMVVDIRKRIRELSDGPPAGVEPTTRHQ